MRARNPSSGESVLNLVRFVFSRKNAQLQPYGTKGVAIDGKSTITEDHG